MTQPLKNGVCKGTYGGQKSGGRSGGIKPSFFQTKSIRGHENNLKKAKTRTYESFKIAALKNQQ